ncbi:DUF2199 domain-containing protein [Rhodovulum sp. DZ06]|uniref:DUF2199 domain-containing protein n=1 Tax=Rhodovulum sp. DZ06 TaxID=3425126 RepID=UPI003D34AFFB
MKPFRFTCACCGETHQGLPAFALDRPPEIHALPPEARAARGRVSDDFCALLPEGGEGAPRMWIRTVMILPIRGEDETLEFGFWLEVSNEDFDRYLHSFDGEQDGMSCRGVLSTDCEVYRDFGIEGLACTAEWFTEARPLLTPDMAAHPLARDWHEGVPPERAAQVAAAYLHR